MDDLLADVIKAHGGLDRWRSLSLGAATIVTGGDLWGHKGLIQDPNPRCMTVSLHQERASLKPFGDPDWHTEFTPERIAIVRSDGSVVNERMHPRASFAGHGLDTPWDPLHRAYFNGYAMWTYLTTSFLFTMERVRAQEVEPWAEASRIWRVLRVEFPVAIATHSRFQDFYFGDDLSLRRHDYAVDVAGGFAAAQIVDDYIEADGICLPSKRRAYLRGPDHTPNLDVLLVSINISDVRFT
jgi:hypothetical protein